MRLRRPWPLQKWRRGEIHGRGFWMVHHSRILARIGKCKCIRCHLEAVGQ